MQEQAEAVELMGYKIDLDLGAEAGAEEHDFKGLPDGRCRYPHWSRQDHRQLLDHEEILEARDAFYMSPGHIPSAEAGREFVQFKPTLQLAEVTAVIRANACSSLRCTDAPSQRFVPGETDDRERGASGMRGRVLAVSRRIA